MVNEYGKVMAFSAKTLFNGDNLGLQTYSVVRVFDYVTKVLMDFLNRRAFENFNARTRKELMNQIVKFLDGITGPDKLIEDFTIKRFEQDPNQKDRVYLDIHMPTFSGFDFIKTLKNPPIIVLTTSDKNLALEAFEYKSVVDYLVKPITIERFNKSLEKLDSLSNSKIEEAKPKEKKNLDLSMLM